MIDVETFHVVHMSECPKCGSDPAGMGWEDQAVHRAYHIGWYWRRPGSVFEDARGPFRNEELAIADAENESKGK